MIAQYSCVGKGMWWLGWRSAKAFLFKGAICSFWEEIQTPNFYIYNSNEVKMIFFPPITDKPGRKLTGKWKEFVVSEDLSLLLKVSSPKLDSALAIHFKSDLWCNDVKCASQDKPLGLVVDIIWGWKRYFGFSSKLTSSRQPVFQLTVF